MSEYEELKKSYKTLERLHDATNDAVRQLTAEMKVKDKQIELLIAEKRQWEEEKIKQQAIIQQQLSGGDSNLRALQDEIRLLKREFKLSIRECTDPEGIIKVEDLLKSIRELY